MKRFLLWLLGVVLGVALFVGAVLAFSWYTTGTGALPDSTGAALQGQPLQHNGYCWQVPLLGALADKVLAQSPDLTTQKLGELATTHPELTLPAWATEAQLTITSTDSGAVCFSGSAQEYAAFAYPAGGTYEMTLQAWRLPAGMQPAQMAPTTALVAKAPGLERPAKPVGWYSYRCRFVLSGAPTVTLSTDRAGQAGQGDVVAVTVTGLFGGQTPTVQTELGTVVLQPADGGWKGYLGVAYNAESGSYTVTATVGSQTAQAQLTVAAHDYGWVRVDPEPEPTEEANAEFRSSIWPLYTAQSGARQWGAGRWTCPVDYRGIAVNYGELRVVGSSVGTKSNSTRFWANEGTDVVAPAAGTVVFAGQLQLTGNTVVIDHGCGVRTYLYGLATLTAAQGDRVEQGAAVGIAAAQVTLDMKVGSKSVDPWAAFGGAGGLFA